MPTPSQNFLDPSRNYSLQSATTNQGPQLPSSQGPDVNSQSGSNPWTTAPQDGQADPWAGYDSRFRDLYAQHGINTPGAAGSGFTDVAYWNNVLNGSAKGDWNYIQNRLGSDLSGTGPDQPAGSPQGGTNGFNYSPWQQSGQENQLFNMLMDRAKQGLNLSPKDPIIANQVNAYGAQQTRGARDYLRGLAESQGPQANMSMEKRMASEKASQATGGMQAQLMQNELNARRQEIQNALTQMGGMLTADQTMALQKELAYLSNDQFLRSLGLQAQNQAYNQYAQQSGMAG